MTGKVLGGNKYSQRSEAKQLLESVNLNFIDFVMSQVSEMTEVQRLISKSLVSKTGLLRAFTEGIPALNQRNTLNCLSSNLNFFFCLKKNVVIYTLKQVLFVSLSKQLVLLGEHKTISQMPSSFKYFENVSPGSAF